MLAHAALDDLGDHLERRPVLLLLVVAQPDRVRELRDETCLGHRLREAEARLFVQAGLGALLLRLLVHDARLVHERVRVVRWALVDERARVHQVILLILDGGLQLDDALPQGGRVGDGLARLERRLVQPRLEECLCVVQLVLLDLGAHLHELLVRLHCELEIGDVVVAVGEERERRARHRELELLLLQHRDGVVVLSVPDHAVDLLRRLPVAHHSEAAAAAAARGGAHRRSHSRHRGWHPHAGPWPHGPR